MVEEIRRLESAPQDSTVVNSVTAPSKKTWQQHVVKRCKSLLDWSSSITKVVSATGSVLSFYKTFTFSMKVSLKSLKIPNIFSTPYTVVELIGNVKNIFISENLSGRIRAGLKVITNIDGIIGSAASSIGILTTAKLVSDAVGSWIPYFGISSFFVGFISLESKAEGVVSINKLRRDVNGLIQAAEKGDNETKATTLKNVLERLQKEKVERLAGRLSLSKKIDLAKRVDDLRVALSAQGDKTRAINDSSEFLKILAPRISRQFKFELAELVNKVAITVGSLLLTFTPFSFAGAIIMFATASVSFVLMAGRAMLIHKNPFDEESRSKAEALLDALIPSRKEALRLRKKIKQLSSEQEEERKQFRLKAQEQKNRIETLEARANLLEKDTQTEELSPGTVAVRRIPWSARRRKVIESVADSVRFDARNRLPTRRFGYSAV